MNKEYNCTKCNNKMHYSWNVICQDYLVVYSFKNEILYDIKNMYEILFVGSFEEISRKFKLVVFK